MKFKKSTPTKSKAQAMVEFAIALPLLLLLLYGLLEAGRLLFLYSTVVTASREAVRYGSATGEGTNGVFRYRDCDGMKDAAQNVAFLGPFDTITIVYDTGPGDPPQTPNLATQFDTCDGSTDGSVTLTGNTTRVVVTVTEKFIPIVPNIVPFLERDITAKSARTILNSVSIVVEQPAQVVVQEPTITEITSDTPDPSAIDQSVTVQVTVINQDNDPSLSTPSGTVNITGADTNCEITLTNGSGSCTIVFTSAGSKTILATYSGDDEHVSSQDTEGHTVTLWQTDTQIIAVPSPSIRNQDVVVTATVTGGPTPTGTVEIDAGGNRNCTITLSNGTGSCTISFNQAGSNFTITGIYSGDSAHEPSQDSVSHQVLAGTPTPTVPPPNTPIPSITPTPTNTPVLATATVTPTAVPVCNGITHGPITSSGNTMSMTITNPYAYPLTTGDGTVTWNDDKGHQTGSDKTLSLQSISIGSSTVWTGNSNNTSTMPWTTPAVIPANSTVTITFTFHQSYDNFDGTEFIFFQITTNGCNGVYVSSS